MAARLTIYLPDRPARVFTFDGSGDVVVGRDEGSTVRLVDDRVSRRHAVLRRAGEGWELADLRSKNGTRVDGAPVRGAATLQETSWLSFGGLLGRFDVVSDEALARGAEERLRRWQSSVEMQRRLTPSHGLPVLLERLLDSVLQLSETERAFVVLADGKGDLVLAATAGVEADALRGNEFAGSIGAVERALAERRVVATSDAQADPLLAARPSIAESRIRALVCVPLLSLDRVLGALYADSTRPGKTFTDLDVEILEGLASHAALGLSVSRLDAELEAMAAALPAGAPRAVRGTEATRREGVPGLPRWRDFLLARSAPSRGGA